ncbi:MAG: hypothetical protein ACXIVD_16930 [Salinarimonas sp.]
MALDVDQLKNQIPFYLTAEPAQKELVQNLRALLRGARSGYYISSAKDIDDDTMLQGDGWNGFQLYSFQKGVKRSIQGIVLSNSCDISKNNRRDISPKIIFAPIIRLSSIETRLEQRGLCSENIENRITSITTQSVTNVFFLPSGGQLEHDSVVLLDDLHSMPVGSFVDGKKLFTLSMAGFYLFAFKLSVHFCRLHEQVDRRQ